MTDGLSYKFEPQTSEHADAESRALDIGNQVNVRNFLNGSELDPRKNQRERFPMDKAREPFQTEKRVSQFSWTMLSFYNLGYTGRP